MCIISRAWHHGKVLVSISTRIFSLSRARDDDYNISLVYVRHDKSGLKLLVKDSQHSTESTI